MIYHHITELIGNTPLFEIDPSIHGLKHIKLYAKLELFNPFGSVKDRIAWGMIRDDIAEIQRDHKTILESSSGNTAKALQALASVFGVRFKTITNRIKVPEAKGVLQVLGAEIQELPGKSDCHDPNDPNDPVVFINREIQSDPNGVYFTKQYSNLKNLKTHYETTGEEIAKELASVDYFFAGLGTTGSSRGTAEKLKESNPNLATIGIAATKRDYIPGIRNGDEILEVGLFEPSFYEEIRYVDSTQAVNSTLELIKKTGILAGPTSGACYHAALEYLKEIDATLTETKNAVFIVCDRVEWYTSYIKERRPDLFPDQAIGIRACKLSDEEIEVVPTIEIADAEKWIKENNPMIVDIRGHQSFNTLRIPNSLNVPDSHLEQILYDGKPFDDTRPILFVCPVGKKSKTAAAHAMLHGYKAFSLNSGIMGWKSANMPLEASGPRG